MGILGFTLPDHLPPLKTHSHLMPSNSNLLAGLSATQGWTRDTVKAADRLGLPEVQTHVTHR